MKIPPRVIDLITLFIYLRVIWRYCVRSRVPRPWKKKYLSAFCSSLHILFLCIIIRCLCSLPSISTIISWYIYIYICVCACIRIRFYVTVLCVYIRACVCMCVRTYIHMHNNVYSLLLLLTYYTCRRNARNWLPGSDPPN